MPRLDRPKKRLGFASAELSSDTEPSPATSPVPTPVSPFQLRQAFGWAVSDFTSVAWSPDGQHVAAGSRDRCMWIWDANTGVLEHCLAGHRNVVRSVAWSPDGQFLASGSSDGACLLWSCQSWQPIKHDKSPGPKHYLLAVDFTVDQPAATTFGDNDIVVQSWVSAAGFLLDAMPPATVPVLHSTSAKIVFVGESNVGKSCLALRLTEDRYAEQGSTLGMQLWTLPPEQLDPQAITPPGEKRDVTLWDLGGQDEYRLVHQLFLHDTTLALVLLDPSRGRTAFEEAEGWNLRLEKQLRGHQTMKFLVGTKGDQATTPVDHNGLQQLLTTCGFAGYYATSAKTGDGIAELRAAMAAALDWDTLAKTTRPVLFQRVRDAIDTRRARGEIVLLYEDLEKQLQQEHADLYEPEAVHTVVQQLTLQGVLTDTRLASGRRLLVLQIGEIERYAGSLILTARNHPRGVPALEERDITEGRLAFPGIESAARLHPFQERIVLESVVQLLLEHGICFKHAGLIIFPALFPATLARQAIQTGEAVSLFYDFSGPIDNIYSALVVTLALSERFGHLRLWSDGAEFEKNRSRAVRHPQSGESSRHCAYGFVLQHGNLGRDPQSFYHLHRTLLSAKFERLDNLESRLQADLDNICETFNVVRHSVKFGKWRTTP